MASHTVIDRCVWCFEDYDSDLVVRRGPPESIFLPFMCRLRSFEIYATLRSASVYHSKTLSSLMSSLCISLTSPATLEQLELTIQFCNNRDDFDSDMFCENLRDAEAWSYLDSITTHPSGSRLQQVNINLDYYFCYDEDLRKPDEDEVLRAVYDGLPLLCKKGILFVKVTWDCL